VTTKITIIGAGPGGYVAAIRAAQLGAEVTVIEQDNVGGTCLNWGCIPSKIMKQTAEILRQFEQAAEFGIELHGKVSTNMLRLLARQKEVITNQAKGILRLFDAHRVSYLKGQGYIEDSNVAVVRLEDGRTREVSWDRLILAPGSKPLDIPAFPFDGRNIISSNDALTISEVPKTLLIVGGGVVGCEFAFIFSSLGARVTVVEGLSRLLPLPSLDEDCSKIIQREMKKSKITYLVNQAVKEIEEEGGNIRVTIGPSAFNQEQRKRDSKPLIVTVDKVLVSIGRKSNTHNIGLEKLGVKVDDKGWIIADERMATNVPGVYAIGDVLGPSKVMLAHVASAEGLVAAENAIGGNRTMNYAVVPGVVFTMPEVANVGLTEAQAQEQGYTARSDSVLFRTLGKPQVIGEIAGQAKIVSDAENGRILGVHIVGPHASDLIAEATLAMQMRATVKDLAETIHAHPTLAEIMLEASHKALGKCLHG